MQPLDSSTRSSSCLVTLKLGAPTSAASTFTSERSLTRRATRMPCWLVRMCCRRVVFPAPRKPDSSVTGSLFSAEPPPPPPPTAALPRALARRSADAPLLFVVPEGVREKLGELEGARLKFGTEEAATEEEEVGRGNDALGAAEEEEAEQAREGGGGVGVGGRDSCCVPVLLVLEDLGPGGRGGGEEEEEVALYSLHLPREPIRCSSLEVCGLTDSMRVDDGDGA
eukprot:762158-Hanusia_phi.AAC.1